MNNFTNFKSGLLSKTIEKARWIDMSSLNSCLTLSVCIMETKQKSKAGHRDQKYHPRFKFYKQILLKQEAVFKF